MVNSVNYRQVPDFLKFVRDKFSGKGVMFYFHTPYYGIDDLFLEPHQKQEAISSITECKRQGFPVLNSYPGLNAILTGDYDRPASFASVIDDTGEYICCRDNDKPDVCEHCGYATCAEIVLARRLNPQAAWSLLKVT